MQGGDNAEGESAMIGPTFARYSEPRLRAVLKDLDPDDPADKETRTKIERLLATHARD